MHVVGTPAPAGQKDLQDRKAPIKLQIRARNAEDNIAMQKLLNIDIFEHTQWGKFLLLRRRYQPGNSNLVNSLTKNAGNDSWMPHVYFLIAIYLQCIDLNTPPFEDPSSSPKCLLDIVQHQPNQWGNSYLSQYHKNLFHINKYMSYMKDRHHSKHKYIIWIFLHK